MFIILIMVIASQVYTYVRTNQIVHYKYVQFNVYLFYLNKAIKKFPLQQQPQKNSWLSWIIMVFEIFPWEKQPCLRHL